MATRITPTGYGRMFNAALQKGLVTESEIAGLLKTLENIGMGFEADAQKTELVCGDSARSNRYRAMVSDLFNAIEGEVEFKENDV